MSAHNAKRDDEEDDSLHGNAPDKAETALLLIDVINDFEFPEGDQLLSHALPMARNLRALKIWCAQRHIPAVYVNDNFGRWRSDFSAQVEHCLNDGVRGQPVVELLRPQENDYFVLKPKHSGFYCTCLDLVLQHLGVRNLILTGVAANNCVLFTANDAYMRDYRLTIPRDCVASQKLEETEAALHQMAQILKAHTPLSGELEV